MLGGANGLFTGSTTGSIGVDGPGLAGSTAGQMSFLFLLYLAPKLVWNW